MISPIWETDEEVELGAAAGGDDVLAKRCWNDVWICFERVHLSCLTALKQGAAPFVFIGFSRCECQETDEQGMESLQASDVSAEENP